MFLILGSPRSGTTLLSSTLNLNDRIVIPDETDFIIPAAFIFDRVRDPAVGKMLIKSLIVSGERFPHSLGEYLSVEDVEAAVDEAAYGAGAIVSAVYGALARKAGADIAGDKSPNDLLFSRILVKTRFFDDDVRIIHLVRDIRDVMLSLRSVTWAPDDIVPHFPRFWSASNLYLYHLFSGSAAKYTLVKYEDMVREPNATFRRLTNFLDVPFEERMLNASERGLRYRGIPSHENLQSPFLAERAENWRTRIDSELRQACESQAHEALMEFGYL